MQSTREYRLLFFAQALPYVFSNPTLLHDAFVAGDITNLDNREGHRGMAQVGDTVIATVIVSEGYLRGVSREEQQNALSLYKSKKKCEELARIHNLHQIVQICRLQEPIGPQPTVLKNTLAAIVGAVWIDSRNHYRAVTGVMEWLGLVNCTDSASDADDQNMGDSSDPSPVEEGSSERESVLDIENFDFDAFADPDVFEAGSNDSTSLNPDILRLPQDTGGSGAPTMLGGAEDAAPLHVDIPLVDISYPGLVGPLFEVYDQALAWPVNDQQPLGSSDGPCEAPTTYFSCDLAVRQPLGSEPQASTGQERVSTGRDSPRVDSMSPVNVQKSDQQTEAALRQRKNPTLAAKDTESCLRVFTSYLREESAKLVDRHDEYLQFYGHMMRYEKALSSIDTPHQRNLAIMAVQFGNWSAMRHVKQALASIRSPTEQSSFLVRRNMPRAERLEAINRLEITTAQLRLALWLHLHALYQEVTHDLGRGDEDGFILVTNADSTTAGPQGNPRNLELSAVARHMSNRISSASPSDHQRTVTRMKKYRRLGRRLQMIVHRWGRGALALLDASFTNTLLLALNDAPFLQFLRTMDHFEGPRIRAVSNAAGRAIAMFMVDEEVQSRLRIEDIDESVLETMPRLSTDMELLFAVAD